MEDDKIIELFWKRSEAALTETERNYSKYCVWQVLNLPLWQLRIPPPPRTSVLLHQRILQPVTWSIVHN